MLDNATNYISNKDIVQQQPFRQSVLLMFVIIWKFNYAVTKYVYNEI